MGIVVCVVAPAMVEHCAELRCWFLCVCMQATAAVAAAMTSLECGGRHWVCCSFQHYGSVASMTAACSQVAAACSQVPYNNCIVRVSDIGSHSQVSTLDLKELRLPKLPKGDRC